MEVPGVEYEELGWRKTTTLWGSFNNMNTIGIKGGDISLKIIKDVVS